MICTYLYTTLIISRIFNFFSYWDIHPLRQESVRLGRTTTTAVCKFARSCSVGYAQSHTRGMLFTPGITLQKTSVSSLGHSYPYAVLLEVLYGIHSRTQNFWKFCTPVPQIPRVRVYNYFFSNLCELCTPVHNTRNFCEFCITSVPYP